MQEGKEEGGGARTTEVGLGTRSSTKLKRTSQPTTRERIITAHAVVAARLQDVQDYRSAELHVPELFRPVQKEAINAMDTKPTTPTGGSEDQRIRGSDNLTRISFYQRCMRLTCTLPLMFDLQISPAYRLPSKATRQRPIPHREPTWRETHRERERRTQSTRDLHLRTTETRTSNILRELHLDRARQCQDPQDSSAARRSQSDPPDANAEAPNSRREAPAKATASLPGHA